MNTRLSQGKRTESAGLLIGDDEAAIRHGLKKALSEQGFLVRLAASGKQAIRMADMPEIEIVLLDSMMHGLVDGLSAAKIIHDKHPEKPIIFISGHSGNPEYRRRAAMLGIENVEWIGKPSTKQQLEHLLAAIRRMAREVQKRRIRSLLETGKAEGVGPRLILRLLSQWGCEVDEDIVEELVAETRKSLLDELRVRLAETRCVLARSPNDFQAVEVELGPFQQTVMKRLWDLYEKSDPSHRRLASLLDVAVRQLSSLDLEEQHVDALEFVLLRLARPALTREDIRECKRALRHRGVETLMDLGRYREPLLAIYRDDESGEEEEEGST